MHSNRVPTSSSLWTSSVLLAAAALASCTLFSSVETEQCVSDADCSAFGDASCSEQGVCVLRNAATTVTTTSTGGEGGGAGGGEPQGCVSNQQCVDDNGQLPYMCREPGQPCVSLLSEDCIQVFGDFADPNAIVFGMMAPLSGSNEIIGRDYLVATELAVSEFGDFIAGGGLPGGSDNQPRPIVIVACDEIADPERAARHLVDNVKVPAIQGPAFSDEVLEIAPTVTIPAGVMLLSAGASSPALVDLPDDGLVWSASPNSVGIADPYAAMLPQVEAKVREQQDIPASEDVKLALIVAGDVFSLSVASPLGPKIVLNGRSAAENEDSFRRFDYSDPTEDDAVDYSALVASVLAFEPQIVTLVGGIEQYEQVMRLLEENWPEGVPRPEYAQLDKLVPALTDVTVDKPELRTRIRGIRSRVDFSNPNYQAFRIRYQGVEPEGAPPGPFDHLVYDTLYLLVYAAMANGSVDPASLTGARMATGLLRLNPPGVAVNVGPDELQQGVNLLVADSNAINFEGTGGPTDFDPDLGSPPTSAEVWCLNENNDFQSSGQIYDPATDELIGEFSCVVPE